MGIKIMKKQLFLLILIVIATFSFVGCGLENNKYIITQYADESGSQGMFYSIITPEKKLIIIDGGNAGNSDQLRRVINENGNCVDAWIITHPHPDHVDAFNLVYSNPGDIIIKDIYSVFIPHDEYLAKSKPWDVFASYERFMELMQNETSINYVTKGDVLNICGIEMCIYNTYYDYINTISNDLCNDGSMMFELKFTEKSFLFCADVGQIMSDIIISEFGNEIDADFVQMGHHGNGGLSTHFYELVSPETAFFDAPDWLMFGETYDTPAKTAFMKSIGSNIFSYNTAPNTIIVE